MKDIEKEVISLAKYLLVASLAGIIAVTFIAQRNIVNGSSMEPSLEHNDQLIVQKITRLFSEGIKQGDIVIVDAKGLPNYRGNDKCVKRVIGVPGDKIEIKDKTVYVNNKPLEENYLNENTKTDYFISSYRKITLKEDQYYVLGDNREKSMDSRTFGPVTRKRIKGEVLVRIYPFDTIGRP